MRKADLIVRFFLPGEVAHAILQCNLLRIRPMRYWLEYIPFIITASIVRTLPRTTALKIGGWLGSLGRLLQPRRVRIATENLQHAYPEMSPVEIAATIDKMFTCLGQSFVEMLRLDKYRDVQDLSAFFHTNGVENVRNALALGRGCIILTGHVGFWEAGNICLPMLGIPFAAVAKPMHNRLVDKYFQRMRTSAGSYLIGSRKGARGILKALQNNHCVGLLLDQHIGGKSSVSVPFFGRQAHTTTIITQMAIRYRVPIIPAFVYRRRDTTYQCDFGSIVVLEGDLSDESVRANTALLNRLTEEGIRKEIGQWFWLHRRWRPCCEP